MRMRKQIRLLFLIPLTLASCATYKKQTSDYATDYRYKAETEISKKTRDDALKHPLYDFIPFQHEQMHFYDFRHIFWYLLGNEQDGIFGEGQYLQKPYSTNINFLTFCSWQSRNPLHNAFYYPPVGSACFDKHVNFSLVRADKSGFSLLRKDEPRVFGSGNYAIKFNFNDFKPFFSLKLKKFETYFGWREKGNLGFSLRFNRKEE